MSNNWTKINRMRMKTNRTMKNRIKKKRKRKKTTKKALWKKPWMNMEIPKCFAFAESQVKQYLDLVF
jgi:hypothetical protein